MFTSRLGGAEHSSLIVASALVTTTCLIVFGLQWAKRRRSRNKNLGCITKLHRFAIKGLERDVLNECFLEVGNCIPGDRSWAMLRTDQLSEFDPKNPGWVNKMSFYAACSAGQPLSKLVTSYTDANMELTVCSKQSGECLLQATLGTDEGRAMAETFFSSHLAPNGSGGAGVRFVRADVGKPHQFGNTTSGVEATGDVRTIHLVNLATVRALSAAAGEDINVLRFRANVLFDGLEPWEEFKWVGHRIALGPEVEMRVIKRTVRCAATCVDLDTGSKGCDVPGLLQRLFPEHGPYLGVYAQVVKRGAVKVGDTIKVI